MYGKRVLTVLLLLLFSVQPVQGQPIHLSIAASMTDAFKELLTNFSAKHPSARLRPNFASSGSLAKQIEQGAPADFYVAANPKWMQYLKDKQMIAPGTDRIFVYNSLVFIGGRNTTAHSLADLADLERVAIGTPQNVPAGQYARQAMDRAGIYKVLERNRKLVMAKDVRQALLYADRGEVDGAFVYTTDATLATRATILFTIPPELYDRVSYPLALTRTGAEKKLAKDFYDYMSSEEARATLARYGFETTP